MKIVKYLICILLITTSCKTKKTFVENEKSFTENISAKKVAQKHADHFFNQKTIDAKLKVHFKNKEESHKFSVRMKIIKNEVIWLKGSYFIQVFRAKITPNSFSYYSPLNKEYFEGDYALLEEMLGFKVNFEQLQNILLGQSFLNLEETPQQLTIVDNNYELQPRKQSNLFDVFCQISPTHFKLKKQLFVNSNENERLDIWYPKYRTQNSEVFPEEIKIIAKNPKQTTEINSTLESVKFNTTVKIPFRIPSNYKKIEL